MRFEVRTIFYGEPAHVQSVGTWDLVMQTWIKQGSVVRYGVGGLPVGILIAVLMDGHGYSFHQNWKFYTSLGIHPGVWYLYLNGLIIGCV
jgi:hypothetical protein